MSRVMYNSKRLIPAPLISISKQYTRSNDGVKIGKIYNISVIGTIMAFMGSPTSDGTFWTSSGYPTNETVGANSRLSSIQRKQEAIRDLFSDDGYVFEYQALDGTQTVSCNPRVTSIEFSDDIWYDKCQYTITLETDELYPKQEDVFSEYISAFSENWVFETNEDQPEGDGKPRTYRLSHTVSATGKRFYKTDGSLLKDAWQAARDYILPKLGFDSVIALASGVANLPSYYTGYNHVRSNNQNESDGSYEVTENWIIASGTASEDYTIDKSSSVDEPYTKVSINGTITGYEQRDSNLNLTTSKYTNAAAKFTEASGLAITRAQTYSGLTLNIFPLRESIGTNVLAGTITYSYEFDDRPIVIAGARSANVSINDSLLGQKFASIFVLGRTAGPVLQDLSAGTEMKRSLNIDASFNPVNFGSRTQGDIRNAINNNPRHNTTYSTDINNIIAAASPSGLYSSFYKSSPQENWSPLTGSYSYNVEWVYQ